MSESGPRPWGVQGDLFTDTGVPVGSAEGTSRHDGLARRLPPGVRLGSSSWSFPGWAGIVYDRPADQRLLSRFGLAAYARHPLLRATCVDRSWYGPLEPRVWRRWSGQVPDDFRFVIKADRALTTPAGGHFLDADFARERVVEPAREGLGDALAAVIHQFPPLDPRKVGGPGRFAHRLHRFLAALPREPRPAVEIRNGDLLTPDYVAALAEGGGVHVHVVHPGAAPLRRQLARIPPASGGIFLSRWMLRPALGYEEARELYDPFDRLEAPDTDTRGVLARAVREASEAGAPSLVIVNNKAEGSAPLSVVELAREIAGERAPGPG